MEVEKRVSASLQDDRGTWVVRGRVWNPDTESYLLKSKSTKLKVKDKTKRQAERVMRDIIARWEKEANREPVYEDPTFREVVEDWLEMKTTKLKDNTTKAYRGYADLYILPKLGNKKVRELRLRDLQRFYNQLLESLSVNSVKRIHVVVHGALLDAARNGIIENDFSGPGYVEFPPAQRFEGKAYTQEQFSILLSYARQVGEPMLSAVILATCYGLRQSEVIGLRWSDIDFAENTLTVTNTVVERGSLRIEEETTKTKSSHRVIALIPGTVDYLKELREKQIRLTGKADKVCCWPNGSIVHGDYLTKKLHKIQKMAGLEQIRFHDLRHTAASLLLQQARMQQVSKFLGHSDIAVTMNIYGHLFESERVQTSETMGQILHDTLFSELFSEKGIGEQGVEVGKATGANHEDGSHNP